MTRRYPADEIDLLDLLVRFLKLLSKNLILIIACFIITIAISLIVYSRAAPSYKSDMLLYTNILGESYQGRADFSLKQLTRDMNPEVLADRLHLTREEAAAINQLNVESAQSVSPGFGPDEQMNFFVVVAEIKNVDVLPKLQESLIQFLRDNPFVKEREEQNRRSLTEVLEKLDKDISKLDSIKMQLANGTLRLPNNSTIMNPSAAFASSAELYEKRMLVRQQLERVNSIQLVEGFVAPGGPSYPRLSFYLGLGIFAGLLLSAGLIVIRYVNTLIRETKS